MDNDKNIIITVLIIMLLALCIIFGIRNTSHPSIEEQAELLRECDYDLNYEAIEEFSRAWDDYVAGLEDEQEYRDYYDY